MNEVAPEREPAPVTPPEPVKTRLAPRSRRNLFLAIGGGAALGVLGIWLVTTKLPGLLTRSPTDEAAEATPGTAAQVRKINATLFYVGESGLELVPVTREVQYGTTPAEQARRIVEAQIQAAPQGLSTSIPAATKVRNVFLTPGGEAYVDFSGEFTTGHSGGSFGETMAVFAIVNALTMNLPDITAVQILIDGKEVDTLAGHVDLRHPIKRSLAWVKKG